MMSVTEPVRGSARAHRIATGATDGSVVAAGRLPLTQRERWALALLALSGCVFLPFALNRFVFPKLAVVAAGALLGTMAPARGRLPRVAITICAAGCALLLAAALTGATPAAQLLGRPPRYEGVPVLLVYLTVLAVGARILSADRAPGASAWWLRWLSVAALAIAVEAVLESVGLRPLASNVARPGSLFGNASDEGAWGVLALGPLTAVALRVGGRLRIAGALAGALIVVCSGSRGALLGAVTATLILVALTPRPGLRVLLMGGLAVIAIGVFALPETRARVTGESPLATQTARGRQLLWGETLRLVSNKPLLGVGPGGYLDAIPAYHDKAYERQVGPRNPPESPHNVVLQAADAGGIALAGLAIALAVLIGRAGLTTRRGQATGGEEALVIGMLAGLAGYGVTLLFFFTTPGSTPLAALMAGALLSEPLTERRSVKSSVSPPDSRGRAAAARGLTVRLAGPALRIWQVVLALLVVILAAAAAAEIPQRSAITAVASDHFPAANKDFRLAHDLRPWDGNVDAVAAHAYATLVRDGIASAAPAGMPWSTQELSAYPDWVQALADGAAIDAGLGRLRSAKALLSRALARDPENPELHAESSLIQGAEEG
jgi:O-Antigen ligase